jgi:hypothetical protein
MNAKLKKIDEAGEIILGQYRSGKITAAQYAARLRKLVARAEAIFAKMAG